MRARSTTAGTPNGYEVRTVATKALLLDAAEKIFVRDGFESAQLDAIARAADRSKGAIYAHYDSKEALFLALYEERTRRQLERLAERLRGCRSRTATVRELKKFLLELTKDKSWPLLTLEFKLYSVRHPESRKRLIALTEMVNSLGRQVLQHGVLDGLTAKKREQLERKGVAITPLIASLSLETYFAPEQLSEKRLDILLGRFLDVVLEDLA